MNNNDIIIDRFTNKTYILNRDGNYYKKRKFNGSLAALLIIFPIVSFTYAIVTSFSDDYRAKSKADFIMKPAFYIMCLITGMVILWAFILTGLNFEAYFLAILFLALGGLLLLFTSRFRMFFYEKAAYGTQSGKYVKEAKFYSILPYINSEGYLVPVSRNHAILAALITSIALPIYIILLVMPNSSQSWSTLVQGGNGKVYSYDGTNFINTHTEQTTGVNDLI